MILLTPMQCDDLVRIFNKILDVRRCVTCRKFSIVAIDLWIYVCLFCSIYQMCLQRSIIKGYLF